MFITQENYEQVMFFIITVKYSRFFLFFVCFSLVMFISDNESFNPSLWEEQRKQRAQVAFDCDEDKDEREAPPRVSPVLPSSLKQVC